MPKISEVNQSANEVILPIDQKDSRSQQIETKPASYGVWTKAGLVFAATTGAFVLTRATGALSWASSWFGGESTIDENYSSELTTQVTEDRVVLSSNSEVLKEKEGSFVGSVVEGFDAIDAGSNDEIETFEEMELLESEEQSQDVGSGKRKLLSNTDGEFELSDLNGVNGFKINGEFPYDYSGYSLSAAGDVNGDGIGDLIIGAKNANPDGKNKAGISYVIFGKNTTFPSELDLSDLDGLNGFKINGEIVNVSSGYSVSAAGDVNGDGFDDVIIGAEGGEYMPGGPFIRSYVVFGKGTTFSSELNLSSLNGANGFKINGEIDVGTRAKVSGAGDVNGDGFDDVIIGTPRIYILGSRSYVIFGKDSAFSSELNLSSLDGANGFKINGGDYSGESLSVAGDVNGDGFDDVIIGASEPWSVGEEGESYVIFGKNTTFPAEFELSSLNGTNGFKINGESNSDRCGASVSKAGDVNGDGIDDLIVGAYYADPNGDKSGRSYVVFGKNTTFPSELELSSLNGINGFKINGESASDYSGRAVSGAGDINGDGFDDVIVGAIYGAENFGRSYIVFGKSTAFSSELELSSLDGANGFKMNGEAEGDGSGSGFGVVDINGDGIDDVIISSPAANPNGDGSGRVYVIFGKSLYPSLSSTISGLFYKRGDGVVTINGNIVLEMGFLDEFNTIENATVKIDSGFVQTEDMLLFTNQNGIIGSYNSDSGVLTLTGSATLSEYQTALRSIEYNNTVENFTSADRTVSFMVSDGSLNSEAFESTVSVTEVNAVPVLSSSSSTASYTEGTPIVINAAIEISDVDDTNIEAAEISITSGFIQGEDVLNFTNQNGITGNYDGNTGILTLTGSATLLEYQTALRSVTYNSGDYPTDVTRTISFVVNDGNDDSDPLVTSVSVTPVNDAPVLSSTISQNYYTENEPAKTVNSAISILDEAGALSSATVSITSGFSDGDMLEFTEQVGITGGYNQQTGVLSISGNENASVYETVLQNVRYSNTEEDPSEVQRAITFVVNDGELNSNFLVSYMNVLAVDDPLSRDIDVSLVDREIELGEPFSFVFDKDIFVDPDSNLTYSARLSGGGSLPSWLNFDASAGVFSGTAPDNIVSVHIIVSASDGTNSVDSNVFTVSVVNNEPVVTPPTEDDYLGEILGSIGGATAAGVVGLAFWKYRFDKEANRKWNQYPLCNILRKSMSLNIPNPDSNDKNKGYDFRTQIRLLKAKFKTKGGYGSNVDDLRIGNLHVFSSYLTRAIREHVRITPNCCLYFRGNEIMVSDLESNADKIIEMTQKLATSNAVEEKESSKKTEASEIEMTNIPQVV